MKISRSRWHRLGCEVARQAIERGQTVTCLARGRERQITSKGQVTIPRSVREALALKEGDELLFRVERSRALIAKTPDFWDLAGTVTVPSGKRGTQWDGVLKRTRGERAGRRR